MPSVSPRHAHAREAGPDGPVALPPPLASRPRTVAAAGTATCGGPGRSGGASSCGALRRSPLYMETEEEASVGRSATPVAAAISMRVSVDVYLCSYCPWLVHICTSFFPFARLRSGTKAANPDDTKARVMACRNNL